MVMHCAQYKEPAVGLLKGMLIIALAFTIITGLLILSLAAIDELGQLVPVLAEPAMMVVSAMQPAVTYTFLVVFYNPLGTLLVLLAGGFFIHRLGWTRWL
jgi:hypothetical protein